MLSLFLTLALLSSFFTTNVIAQSGATTLFLGVGPTSAPMAPAAGQGEGKGMPMPMGVGEGMGMGVGKGMGMGVGKGMGMGMATGMEEPRARPSGAASGMRGSSSSSNSTSMGERPKGSPAGAAAGAAAGVAAPSEIPANIPTPAVNQNPTFTTPVLVQTGNSPAGMPGMPGMSEMSGAAGVAANPQAQAQESGNNISQAEAAGAKQVSSSKASWSHTIIDQDRAIIIAVLSGFLLCLL